MWTDLSVIVACRNEEENIAACLRTLIEHCPGAEILVIDGGDDRTAEIVAEFCRENPAVIYLKNADDCGKGSAIKTGIGRATRPIIAQFDADLQFVAADFPRLVEPIRRGEADMTLGSRFVADATRLPGATPPLRSLGNYLMSGYASLLFLHRFTDVMAGIKAWRREVTQRAPLTSDTFSYEAELCVKAVQAGFRVVDVPVTTAARQAGSSNIRMVRDGMNVMTDVTRFRFGSAGQRRRETESRR